MSIAVYPGSFDPVTYGHIDIIERSAKVFDKLIIAVLVNSAKKPMFTTQEKVDMIRKVTSHLDNVEVMSFSGLLVDFAFFSYLNHILTVSLLLLRFLLWK